MRRRCAWLALPDDAKAPVVWARKNIAVTSCPRSLITTESEALVEEFLVRRRLGGTVFKELGARQIEAFLILEQALAAEGSDGEHNTRRDLSKLS
jgi:hypothetical protein